MLPPCLGSFWFHQPFILPDREFSNGLLEKLGKHSTGKSCLYINKLEDIDMDVLRELVDKSVQHMKETNT
jgi:hypothetical protein